MKQYIVEQKITAFVNRYSVYEAEDGVKGSLVSFVEQKRLTFKEEIIFYGDKTKSTEAFRVKAEKVMDVHGRFLVTDGQGNLIGAVRKVFKASLLRSTWQILDSNDEARATVREKSLPLAIFRRLWGFMPYIGDLPFFIKYHFVFMRPDAPEPVATYFKTTRFRDHYLLEVSDEKQLGIDWRVMIAQCVLLDALQGR